MSSTVSRCSKRKRAQVSYYEPNENDLDIDEQAELGGPDAVAGSDQDEDYPQTKRRESKSSRISKSKSRSSTGAGPRKKKDQTCFPFLELPAELRNRIYEYCLVDGAGHVAIKSKLKRYRRIVVHENFGRHSGTDSPSIQLQPALLAVNRQIHTEAVSYLYDQTFHADDTCALHNFLVGLGSNRLRLRDIVVHGWACERSLQKAMNHAALCVLADCPNLERVFFDRNISLYLHNDTGVRLARLLYREGYHWLKAMGCDKSLEVMDFEDFSYEDCPRDQRNAPKNPANAKRLETFREELRRLMSIRKK